MQVILADSMHVGLLRFVDDMRASVMTALPRLEFCAAGMKEKGKHIFSLRWLFTSKQAVKTIWYRLSC